MKRILSDNRRRLVSVEIVTPGARRVRYRVRTPPTNKPTDRNHIVRHSDPVRTICGLLFASGWQQGRPERQFCVKCAGLVLAAQHQPDD